MHLTLRGSSNPIILYLTFIGDIYACLSSVNIPNADYGPSKLNIPKIPNTSPSLPVRNGFPPFLTYLFILQYSDVTYKVFLNLFLFFLYKITFLPCAIIYLGACFLLH